MTARVYYHQKRNELIVFRNGPYEADLTTRKQFKVSLRRLLKHGPIKMGFDYIGEL